MNRVIKFRAWDGDKMHNDVSPWRWDFVISNTWHRCEKATGNGILGEGGHYAEMLVPAIRYKEIMQYTGLTDKHGVEIYEGDVVSKCYSASVKTGVVAWHQERAMFIFQDGYNEPLYQLPLNMVEVIGNVFANPELIN